MKESSNQTKKARNWPSLFGTPDTIRTYDLLYRKQTLYPAELRVLVRTDGQFPEKK